MHATACPTTTVSFVVGPADRTSWSLQPVGTQFKCFIQHFYESLCRDLRSHRPLAGCVLPAAPVPPGARRWWRCRRRRRLLAVVCCVQAWAHLPGAWRIGGGCNLRSSLARHEVWHRQKAEGRRGRRGNNISGTARTIGAVTTLSYFPHPLLCRHRRPGERAKRGNNISGTAKT